MPVAPYALLWCNNNLLFNAVENYCCCLQRAFFLFILFCFRCLFYSAARGMQVVLLLTLSIVLYIQELLLKKERKSISARQKVYFSVYYLWNHVVCNISDFFVCLFVFCHFYGGCESHAPWREDFHSGTQLAWEPFVNNGYVLICTFCFSFEEKKDK